jgi:hypothetical protein
MLGFCVLKQGTPRPTYYLQTAERRQSLTIYQNPLVFVCFESPSPPTCHLSLNNTQTRNKIAKFEFLKTALLKIHVFCLVVTCLLVKRVKHSKGRWTSIKQSKKSGWLDHENEGNKIFRNVGKHLRVDMT